MNKAGKIKGNKKIARMLMEWSLHNFSKPIAKNTFAQQGWLLKKLGKWLNAESIIKTKGKKTQSRTLNNM